MRTAKQQADEVRKSLAKATGLSIQNMFVHGNDEIGDAIEVSFDEVPLALAERHASLTCESGTWDVIGPCQLLFYGDNGEPPKYLRAHDSARTGGAEYVGKGNERFTILIGRKDDEEAEEEIDVDAANQKEARQMGEAIIASDDYDDGLKVFDVIGPRYGLYM